MSTGNEAKSPSDATCLHNWVAETQSPVLNAHKELKSVTQSRDVYPVTHKSFCPKVFVYTAYTVHT